ncbi:MAG: hypothetical protein WBM87_00315 [Woeseiaceae bacterium]
MSKDEKDIVWLGDSLSVLQAFPKSVCIDLGSDLRRLVCNQNGYEGGPSAQFHQEEQIDAESRYRYSKGAVKDFR